MDTENKINEILNSSIGITKVAPNEELFHKIKHTLINYEENTISMKWIGAIAASLILLMALNIETIKKNLNAQSNDSEVLVQNISKTNQLY